MKIASLPTAVFRPLRALGVALLFLVGLTGARAQTEDRITFVNSLGPIPAKASAALRPLAVTETTARAINFSVALRMRNFAHLQERIARGELIPAEEMETSYLPLPKEYAALKKWLEVEGFTVTYDDPSRLSVFVQGTLAQIQHSLRTTMVAVAVEGTEYPAAVTAPSLPASVCAPVLGINGLQTYHRLRKHSVRRPQATGVTYKINDILTTFDAKNLGVTGAGQTIAILIDTTPQTSDLTKFWANNNVAQSTSNITTINVNGGTLPAVEGEETLDVEWSSGVAPGAKIRVYATGSLSDSDLDAGLARIISDVGSDATIRQLSISLGGREDEIGSTQLDTDAQYFATLASKGVSTFVSSGDGGSTPDDNGDTTGTLQVESYASDPSVTGVGGTTLNVNASDVRTSEIAWSYSGGGVSTHFAKPSWQTGTGVPSGTKRFVPDVAMPADPYTGAYVYVDGAADVYGGTSWSAPTWAGFCALINEARAKAGKTGGIGLLNPSVYPLIGTANFFDVVSGDNATGTQANGKYPATTGYDEVTGVGTPDVSVLLNTLVGATSSAPTITKLTPTSGPVGTSVTITGTNFTGATSVKFKGTTATFTVDSATQITAAVPTGAATGTITVTTSGGTATSSGTFTVTTTSTPAPTITSFTPTTGPVGTSVAITGTNFTDASAVLFNNKSAAYTVNSATKITATVPTGATTGTVKVTTPGGTATSTATFTVTTSGANAKLVISQVYGGGGSSSSVYAKDYIELYNPTAAAVDLSNYSVQYASSTGTSWQITTLAGSIAAGHYYLVGESGSTTGQALPTPDATGIISMSSTKGKVALVNGTTAITGSTSSTVVDFVGYGTANDYEGSGPAPATDATTADLRAGNGKTDTNNNKSDFTAGTPNPRNSKTTTSAVPAITSDDTATGTKGAQFTYQITATNNPTRYSVLGLPRGLSVNAQTGLISGKPVALGTFTMTLRAINSAGVGTGTLKLTVEQPLPVITSAGTASGKVGTAFSYQIVATNDPTRYGVLGLPTGIKVDATTGLLSGTPTKAGTFTLTLRATNDGGTGSKTLTLTISNK